jgi:hypothetical protein
MDSIQGSAESGALEYLDMSDNMVGDNESAIKAMKNLLLKATNLKVLSISDSGIQEPKFQF